jgi:hypothetical protein
MAQFDPIERLIIHTVCGVRMEFFHPTIGLEPNTGLLEVHTEATPNKRFYFAQIDYIEAIHN